MSTAPLLLVIMGIALALLKQSFQQPFAFAEMMRVQQVGIQAFYQAQSAINWGLSQTWSVSQSNQCRFDNTSGGNCCLYQLTNQQGVLAGTDWQKKLTLWQRVNIDKQHQIITTITNGWTDINPLKR